MSARKTEVVAGAVEEYNVGTLPFLEPVKGLKALSLDLSWVCVSLRSTVSPVVALASQALPSMNFFLVNTDAESLIGHLNSDDRSLQTKKLCGWTVGWMWEGVVMILWQVLAIPPMTRTRKTHPPFYEALKG